MFCPKCGSILIVKEMNKKRVLVCSNCGHKPGSADFTLAEDMKKGERELGVVQESQGETLPITDAECPKCGHSKAYYWMQQTRAADEAETRFFKCEKCKHTWRDYF